MSRPEIPSVAYARLLAGTPFPMTEAQRQLQNARNRASYWKHRAERLKAHARWRAENKAHIREWSAEYYSWNREWILAGTRKTQRGPAYRAKVAQFPSRQPVARHAAYVRAKGTQAPSTLDAGPSRIHNRTANK
jgi:hypothetical protein